MDQVEKYFMYLFPDVKAMFSFPANCFSLPGFTQLTFPVKSGFVPVPGLVPSSEEKDRLEKLAWSPAYPESGDGGGGKVGLYDQLEPAWPVT